MSAPGRRGDVAVVGPGRVGSVLAAALELSGHRVRAVVGRGTEAVERFVERFPQAEVGTTAKSGLVLVTTSDGQIEEAVTRLVLEDEIVEGQRVVHTAGALGLEPLRRASLAGARVAACHPAQTFPDPGADPDLLGGVAWAVTAEDADRGWAHDLVRDTGGWPHDVADGDRLLYHAGLAVASNAVGAAVAVARRLLIGARLEEPAAFLAPLVRASVDNVLRLGADAITGPVRRGDTETLHRHLEALRRDTPDLAEAYRALAEVTLGQVRPALDPDDAAGVAALVAPATGRPEAPL